MFIQTTHNNLVIFNQTRFLVIEAYKVTRTFPPEEKYALIQQIRRAALAALLNVAEGCNRHSNLERRRYFENARGSVIEMDTALDIASELSYSDALQLDTLGKAIISTFRQLNALMQERV